MAVHRLSELTWTEVRDLDRERLVAILATGAVEAHGPHLPLNTDRVIARAMAEDGARRLAERGFEALLLPPIDYTAAGFAAGFPGTLSVRPEVVSELLVDIARALEAQGVKRLAIANAHFDPSHLRSIYEALDRLGTESSISVVFPDVTRKPWALRLTDEFRSGACHAGRYETSIVMARHQTLVREERRRELPANPISLSTAIRNGQKTFQEAGGPRAYFGDPAAATAAEGREIVAILGQILEESVLHGA